MLSSWCERDKGIDSMPIPNYHVGQLLDRRGGVCAVLFLIVLVAILPTASSAQNDKNSAYNCTAEAEGGLFYNKALKKWQGREFTPDHKFVLRLRFLRTYIRKKEDEFQEDETINVYEATITNAGESFAQKCQSYSDTKEVAVGKYNTVFCEAELFEYKINLDSKRYLATYSVGYAVGLHNDDEHSDTPVIEGGTCTKIE
jgi:hypothetical protein